MLPSGPSWNITIGCKNNYVLMVKCYKEPTFRFPHKSSFVIGLPPLWIESNVWEEKVSSSSHEINKIYDK